MRVIMQNMRTLKGTTVIDTLGSLTQEGYLILYETKKGTHAVSLFHLTTNVVITLLVASC